MIAAGEKSVPIAIFLEWEQLARAGVAEMIADYRLRDDAAGVRRVEIIEAQIDKMMRVVSGNRDVNN